MIRELMIPVEKAVRPLCGSHSRKLRMRQELYSLIEDRYRAILAEGFAEDEARQRAIAAFGDPQLIRDELQRSIPRSERMLKRIDRFLLPESRHPSLFQAIRCGVWFSLPLAIWLIVTSGVLAIVVSKPTIFALWPTYLTLAGIFGINGGLLYWLGTRCVTHILSRHWTPVLLSGLLAGAVLSVSLAVLYWVASPFFLVNGGWIRLLTAFPVTMGMFVFVCWQAALEQRQQEPWLALELD
jgi:hypothetical protein